MFECLPHWYWGEEGGGVCGTHPVRCPPTPRGTPRPVTSSPWSVCSGSSVRRPPPPTKSAQRSNHSIPYINNLAVVICIHRFKMTYFFLVFWRFFQKCDWRHVKVSVPMQGRNEFFRTCNCCSIYTCLRQYLHSPFLHVDIRYTPYVRHDTVYTLGKYVVGTISTLFHRKHMFYVQHTNNGYMYCHVLIGERERERERERGEREKEMIMTRTSIWFKYGSLL